MYNTINTSIIQNINLIYKIMGSNHKTSQKNELGEYSIVNCTLFILGHISSHVNSNCVTYTKIQI